jgi:putative Ca2+/H+ antiporter (TMEM165/GDT1 family)
VLQLEWKVFATVFSVVFLAELGDKTQLATVLFATDQEVNKWIIFIAASSALILTSAIGVLAGNFISDYVSEKHLHIIAGVGFITIGVWTLIRA